MCGKCLTKAYNLRHWFSKSRTHMSLVQLEPLNWFWVYGFTKPSYNTASRYVFLSLCYTQVISMKLMSYKGPFSQATKETSAHKRVHTVWSCLCKSQSQAKAIHGVGNGDISPPWGMWEVRTGRIMRVFLECWWWPAYWSAFLFYEGISVCENSSSCIIMYITHHWRCKMKKPGHSETGWLAL